jgi:hypothetical protein
MDGKSSERHLGAGQSTPSLERRDDELPTSAGGTFFYVT